MYTVRLVPTREYKGENLYALRFEQDPELIELLKSIEGMIRSKSGLSWYLPPQFTAEELNQQFDGKIEFTSKGEFSKKKGKTKTRSVDKTSRLYGRVAKVSLLVSFGLFILAAFCGDKDDDKSKRIFRSRNIQLFDLYKKEVATKAFQVDRADEALKVTVDSNINNNWIYFGAALIDANTNRVLIADDATQQYYSGYDGYLWSEGSQSTNFFWRVKKAGKYRILLTVNEMDASGRDILRVFVNKEARVTYLLMILAGFWFLSFVLLSFFAKSEVGFGFTLTVIIIVLIGIPMYIYS